MIRRLHIFVLLLMAGCADVEKTSRVPEAELRVREYIHDAYLWELDAKPPLSDNLVEEMRAALNESKTKGKLSVPAGLAERLKSHEQGSFDDHGRHLSKLDELGTKHWTGNGLRTSGWDSRLGSC